MLRKYFSFVKFEHTAFALPLVFAGAILATRRLPSPRLAALILLAAAGARTFAMAVNRLVDAGIDRRNPRTAGRELPRGALTAPQAWAVALAGAFVYLGAAALISPLCLKLSPVPLVVFVLYPYLKRFTSLAHFGVGLADALGPAGAWVAARSAAGVPVLEDAVPLGLLAAFSVLWIAGFDVIYSLQDEDVDRRESLHSLPARHGREAALLMSAAMHFVAGACLAFIYASEFGDPGSLLALGLIAVLLIEEHRRVDDLKFAFFTANAGISVLVLAFVLAGVALSV